LIVHLQLIQPRGFGKRDARGVQIMSINPRDEQRLVRYAFKREQIGRIARDG
jgi:hypothetical protein